MLSKIVHKNRAHTKAALAIAARNQLVQFTAVASLCVLCWAFGHGWFAFILLVFITATEYSISLLARSKGPLARLAPNAQLIALTGLSAIKVMLYLLPVLVLITLPYIALKLLGIVWLMGAQTCITQTWARIPPVLYAMLATAFAMMIVTFFKLTEVMHDVSPSHHWIIETSFIFIYIYTSANTLHQHIKREGVLFRAEKIASSRLARIMDARQRDPLTGLLNRSAFDDGLALMLRDRKKTNTEVAVLLLDINSFKPINDTYSHEAGDAILVAFSERIKAHLGASGLAARMGGDEFICAFPQSGSDDETIAFAETLAERISQDIQWNGRTFRVTASIGIAITGPDANAPVARVSTLSAAADQAMFVAKSSANGLPVLYRAHLFQPRMTADDKQILIDSITDGTVRPCYQPKVHLTTGQIVGFEALARWYHPIKGQREPKEFIPQINELGLQGDFMTSMAEQVFRDVDEMLAIGLDPGQISLNISEIALATFSGCQELHRIVAAHPRAAKHMTFEITEDVFIARAADAIQTSIETFRNLGVRISLDDFGTGFASFDHLRQLDFDELKIDTSFVAGLEHDTTSQVLVQGFLNIASGLGVGVVAEGVETETQRQTLANMGCVVAQGYLFSHAIPLNAATKMLEQQQAA